MALVSDGFQLNVTLADSGDNPAVLTYNMRAATYAAAVTDAAIIIAALEAVTDSVVEGYSLREKYLENALVLPTGVSNWIKASISIALSTAGKRANLQIPGPNSGVFVSATGEGRDVVDMGDAAVGAYIDLFKAAGQATISDDEDANAITNGSGKRVSSRVTLNGQR